MLRDRRHILTGLALAVPSLAALVAQPAAGKQCKCACIGGYRCKCTCKRGKKCKSRCVPV